MDPIEAALRSSPAWVESLRRRWQDDPSAVDPSWAAFFAGWAMGAADAAPAAGSPVPAAAPAPAADGRVRDIIHAYRAYGHLAADLDPLGRSERSHPLLDLERFGITDADLATRVDSHAFPGLGEASLGEYLSALRETYCGPIGVEHVDVIAKEQRDWLEQQMEAVRNRPPVTPATQARLLELLVNADTFEERLHRMYVGAKRFSLEGGCALVPLLDTIIEAAAEDGVVNIVMGMAHRGRLNVLANVLAKPLEYILAEFEGKPLPSEVQDYGDVKYHLGYSSDRVLPGGQHVHLSLEFNPSHLEAVNPVVEGIVRAKQNGLGDRERRRVIPLLIHGDAAFTGQGVVAETFLLADLAAYDTGGTVHVVINNQVGFTTDPEEGRSARYCTDIAKVARAPVFHVNGDDPEAVRWVAQLAFAFRQAFRADVVIDMTCYRRHGHNELDDPTFTQPVMYAGIARHPTNSRKYAAGLEAQGVVTVHEREALAAAFTARMELAREAARGLETQYIDRLGGAWTGLQPAGDDWSADTRSPRETLERIAQALLTVPDGFTWHPRLEKLMRQRAAMIHEDGPLDWGCAEAMAVGSLLVEGTKVRMTGQDTRRGTFSHRHAVYTDAVTGDRWIPLNHVAEEQNRFQVFNSPLSEAAVLGFEYGYSTADPWSLVCWEAQFGDFVNGAQVIIDQLIASCEYKWGRMSGVVLLLPHGYEGQGPEHSSARLERFLELCAENNMQVANVSTPAQYFHLLRRQVRRNFRKPLVVMTPKSLLRHPRAVSRVGDLTDGTFEPLMKDASGVDPAKIRRVLLASGRITHALEEAREARGRTDVALVRLEQLYPFPLPEWKAVLASYPNLESVLWVQEEPRNMGAWRNLRHRFRGGLPAGLTVLGYAGRTSAAVPATGSYEVHQREEAALIEQAFAGLPPMAPFARTTTTARQGES